MRRTNVRVRAAPEGGQEGAAPDVATPRPTDQGPLPEGLSCWLASQSSQDVEATLTGIRKGFLRHYQSTAGAQDGSTATNTSTDQVASGNSNQDGGKKVRGRCMQQQKQKQRQGACCCSLCHRWHCHGVTPSWLAVVVSNTVTHTVTAMA
jgi:hypothetical protein